MDQDYRDVLKLKVNLNEDELSKLFLSVVKRVGPPNMQSLYTTDSEGNLTTKSERRVETITNCVKISNRGTDEVNFDLAPSEIGLLIDYYFTIFAGSDAKTTFDNFLHMTESGEKLTADLKYLLMAFTSTKFKTEDYTAIYNSVRNDHDGKFKVIVRRDRHYDTPTQQNPNSRLMGLALIVNIKKFNQPGIEYREGSEHDITNLKCLLGQLDCDIWNENYAWNEEWTTKDLKTHVKDFREECDRVKPRYVFLYIGSHGGEDYVTTTDSKIDLYEDIIDLFYDNNKNTTGERHLKQIPKILFINSCRISTNYRSKSKHKFLQTKNLAVIRPQPRGFESYRNRLYGSWGVHCFVFVVMNLAYSKPFYAMMEEVKKIFLGLDLTKEDQTVKYGQKFQTKRTSFDEKFRLELRY